MIRRDYHNTKLEDAIADTERTVSKVRMTGKVQEAEFIVGHGVIRGELIKVLESYGLNPKPQLGNAGVIVCIIE